MTLDQKHEAMRAIRDEVLALTHSPLYAYRQENNYYPVLGEGSHDASIMVVGEAPGKNEAKSGRPFCGAAGKLLDELLASISLERNAIYITNIVKDRPPENRDPSPEEIALYGPFLERQISVIEPKVIVTLGRFSMVYIMNLFGLSHEVKAISALHGTPFKIEAPHGDSTVVPLYHPAAAIYNRALRDTLFEDVQVLQSYV